MKSGRNINCPKCSTLLIILSAGTYLDKPVLCGYVEGTLTCPECKHEIKYMIPRQIPECKIETEAGKPICPFIQDSCAKNMCLAFSMKCSLQRPHTLERPYCTALSIFLPEE